ncbi:CAAX amino terminal protease family [Bernardetia litoralis DSM 6794]|uniref:CAAX amino terminal protease family n=1 Tax=Bernardetia litoralis (strain ATCC 23117 / DSM 6794 / NBRC 15988 / NCIMB 1366 / Fx l1 / Sio-4) TaxID=880071 RepID=I4AQ05_BERLS|nr:CPBP family intramembrane glutamic endopeptidase [Bernardetia litoralis]AFM06040.1 CAAX amino terminal protease family [Bernardetia litoralis DSM 6794]
MKYLFSLLILFVITILTLFASQLIGVFVIGLVYDISLIEFDAVLQNVTSHPELRTAILLLQGLTTQIFGFLAVALFFTKYVYKFNQVNQNSGAVHVMNPKLAQHFLEEPFLQRYKTPALVFLIVFVLAIVAFPAIQLIGALNGAIEFPEFLKGLENWMRTKEDAAQVLTLFMTDFSSPLQTILGFIVIAVLAGLSEEVFFRGVLQPLFQNITKNKHAAIWITAIIFSAIHFQFYGFIPRMLLGALFGYIYIYTNNIAVPIWAHILNNGIALFLALYVDKALLESPQAKEINFILIVVGIVSFVICIGILKFIKKIMEKEVEENLK